jgi:CheY-like chemotaxis protein
MLCADAGMLDQVLMNLVLNARDAMPDGGELVISTSRADLSSADRARFPGARPGPHVCVQVSDTGCGIAPAIMPLIFEPFFTTKAPGKGTGLGLATVFGIVEQHGGALHVDSALGRGTKISVYFPAADGSVQSDGQATVSAPRGGAESVLVVEDEEPVRKIAQRVLEANGYRVRVAATGVQALTICEQEGETFDLVITDMVMPGGVSGRELAERLTSARPALRVIYMSGYPGDVAAASVPLRAGFNFLPKPFDPVKLLSCVRARLEGE